VNATVTVTPGDGGAAAPFDFHRALLAQMPRLRLQALALTRNRDAADLAQDAVRNALAARSSFAPGTDLAAWLYRILRNRFISDRRRAREATGREDDIAVAATLPAPAAQEDALALGELRRALARLPAEQRLALVAVAVQGMRYEEVAAMMGCAVGTAKSRVFRARNQLHAWLVGPEGRPSRRSAAACRDRPADGVTGTRPRGGGVGRHAAAD
jgi:RNA polymerase sigma-70 factor (ECF subfamily)